MNCCTVYFFSVLALAVGAADATADGIEIELTDGAAEADGVADGDAMGFTAVGDAAGTPDEGMAGADTEGAAPEVLFELLLLP